MLGADMKFVRYGPDAGMQWPYGQPLMPSGAARVGLQSPAQELEGRVLREDALPLQPVARTLRS